jgi:hypothetical protein
VTDSAIIEAAARALNGTYETHYGMACAVVAAVTPLIEAAALERAEQAIRHCSFLDEMGNVLATKSAIAAIRALKTKEQP